MYYSELVKKASNIMYEAHKDDKDAGGYPYVFHPFFIATQMDDENSTCAALLHDVLERHSDKYSLESLKKDGFPDEVLEALNVLKHEEGISYIDYIVDVCSNPIAKKVKKADLMHNLDTRRSNGEKFPKNEEYIEALKYLNGIYDINLLLRIHKSK